MWQSKIERVYEKHSFDRICQGDVFRDISFNIVIENNQILEIHLPYIVVVSQDCDLKFGVKKEAWYDQEEAFQDNQFLPNVLFLPAFNTESAREGRHLEKIFKIKQDRFDSNKWKLIKQNQNIRYHYLPSYLNFQIPDLIIDFKNYYSLPTSLFFKQFDNCYLATVNELFREELSQRFSNYLNRIGTPVIETTNNNQ
ncbi:MAG: hypothetical protein ACFFFT_16065 [Candidatus Thorarchaeota archaeon]